MHSKSVWRFAKRPNYTANFDKLYPYSEVPYLGNYDLIKIPVINDDLIELIDYWGEGRIVTDQGESGFKECYNVNHEYQLVSNGADRGKKIPNRIPVMSYTNCDTGGYVKDNSVKVVTLMGAPINKSCAADIARMINNEKGKVVVYGFNEDSSFIKNIEEELKYKKLFYCYKCNIEDIFKEPTLFDSYRVYLNVKDISKEFSASVSNADYAKSVAITKTLNKLDSVVLHDIVRNLLKDGNKNTMNYAYKVWVEQGETEKSNLPMPLPYNLVLNGGKVKLTNKSKSETLKLEDSDVWTFSPEWEKDKVTFVIKNESKNKVVGMESTPDNEGNRKVFGYVNDINNNIMKWTLEPLKKVDNNDMFLIVNVQYNLGLMQDDYTTKSFQYKETELCDNYVWFITAAD